MRYDGKLALKLVAVSEPKIDKHNNDMYRSCYDIEKAWAPDGGPYVGRKLTSSSFTAYGKSEKLPDKVLHFEVLGDSPQGGSIYALPGEGLDKTVGLINGYNRTITHGYFKSNESINQFVLPYFSGGHPSAPITIALTASKYTTIQTVRPPFNIDTKAIDEEFDRRWVEAHKSKNYVRYPEEPNVIYPLAKGHWGSVDLRVTVGYTHFTTGKDQGPKPTTPESKYRKHIVRVIFKPAAVPMRQMVRTSIKIKAGRDYSCSNDGHFMTSYAVDPGPQLEDIESIEIATCPFRTYTLPTVSFRPDPAKFANLGSKANRTVGLKGVATVDSIGVYTLNSYTDRAAKHYTPDGKYWPDFPGEDSFYNQHDKFPYTVYEAILDINSKYLAKGGELRAEAYSLLKPTSPIGKLKPLSSMVTYPGFKGKMKLAVEPAKDDKYLRIDLEVSSSTWKTLGKTSKYIAHENKLLDENREWVHKWMNLTPFQYWLDDAGELVISYTEPRKAPISVKTGIKLPSRNYQARFLLTSNSNQRMISRPIWFPISGGAWLSFDLNEERKAAYSSDGNQLYLKDLKSIELQARPITKSKPILLKLPPPVQRSKTLTLEVR